MRSLLSANPTLREVFNLRLSPNPNRLSVPIILPYGLLEGPIVITTFSIFFGLSVPILVKFKVTQQN